MTRTSFKILLIDDDEDDFILTRDVLSAVKSAKYEIDWASSYEEGLRLAGEGRHDVYLVDYRLGERSGVELIREACGAGVKTPMILLTGQGSHDIDLEAMRAGAADYLVKDETPTARLERAIRYAVGISDERGRAEQELNAYATRHAAVAEIGRLALTGTDLTHLFSEAVTLAARTLRVEFCSVLEQRPDANILLFKAAVGFKPEYVADTIRFDENSQAAHTLLSDKPIVVEDLRTETRFKGGPILHAHEVVSGMSVAIRGRDEPYGVLGIHTKAYRLFTEDDVNFLSSVANTLGEAIGRKNVEDTLREQAALLENAQRIGRMGIWSIDLVKDELIWSNATCDLFGISQDEFRGTFEHFYSFIVTEDLPAYAAAHARVSASAPMLEAEYRIRRPDGTVRSIYERGNVTFDSTGAAVSRLGMAMDVTEQRQAREQMEKSAALLHIAGRAARLGGWSIQLPERTLVWSDENCAIHDVPAGYKPTLEEGLSYYAPKDREEVLRHVDECQTNGTPYDFELPKTTAKGRPIWVRSIGQAVRDGTGKIVGLQGAFQDITESKRAENELRQSENRLRIIFDNSAVGIALVDPAGRPIQRNLALHQMLGYDPDEFIELSFADFAHPDDLNKDADLFREVCEGIRDSYQIEKRYIRKDGETIWVNLTISAVRGDDGELQYAVSIVEDITQRKAAEDGLRKSGEYLALAHEVAKIGSFEFNLKTERGISSSVLASLHGKKSKLGNDHFDEWLKMVHKDDVPKITGCLEEAISTGLLNSEYRVDLGSGGLRWLCAKGKVIYDEKNIPTHLIGVNMDITERKLAEQALRESDQRAICEYEMLLDRVAALARELGTARELITVFRALREFALLSAPMTGLLISLYDSERATRTASYAWNEGVETDVAILPQMGMTNSPHSRAVSTGKVIVTDDFQAAMKGQPAVHIGLDADPVLPQSSIVVPMSVMGKIVGAVEAQSTSLAAFSPEHSTALQMAANLAANAIENVRLLDIERVQAERLRQSQKLESVGLLAGGIAHDFNNMLTAINGFSDLTLRRMAADDPLRRNIQEIKKAGQRSAELTNQLLAFSRQLILQPEVLSINGVIADINAMLERLIGEHVQLISVLNPKAGRVKVDPGQLSQIILNLAVNARDAMPHGGKLTFETDNVFLDPDFARRHVGLLPGAYVMLAVSDTGIGMTPEVRAHIFEPFFTTKEVGKGTGLGLATVYGIVSQSGGSIHVYSEPELGTTFKIYLPRVIEPEDEFEKTENTEDMPAGTETILLVEDENAVRAMAKQILEICGYTVLEAQNGAEAVELAGKYGGVIDLLLTDVVMPKMGGRELAETFAQSYPRMRVLFTSGYTDDAIVRHGVIEALSNFIQKPFTLSSLAQKVRSVLDEPSRS